MKTVLDFVCHPLILGSCVLSVLIVALSYFGSHYYYGEVDAVDVRGSVALPPIQPASQTSLEWDFGEQLASTETELPSDLTPSDDDLSIEAFLAELSAEEQQALTSAVANQLPRESPHGLGPYPEIPPDFPRQNIWEQLEQSYNEGDANINHELINRVLIKLWNQGTKVDSAVMEEGKVYPLYADTIYVRWSTDVETDGTPTRYLGEMLCLPNLAHYEQDIESGITPRGIQVLEQDGAGIDPYAFLDLP